MTQQSTPQADPLIGKVFGGKYTIVDKLGSGGMGGVYKAEQAHMGRFVAIKVLRSGALGDEVQLRRFQQEAKTLSQLSHPNAVTVFDFGLEDGHPYLVMEYIEGKTLKVLIRELHRVPLPRIKGIMKQVCAALSEAHRLGIVHRDIKPENIMLRVHPDGSDWVKVLDFGVAKSVMGNDPNLTQAGVLVGTPQYMSPEQCRGSELDARADIYCLGVVLYEMLSGEVPFQAPSVLELLMKVMNTQPDSLRKFKQVLTLPVAVDAVVLKALAKDPAARFQTMADFYSSFEKSVPLPRKKGQDSDEGESRRVFFAILGCVLLVLIGASIWFFTHRNSSPSKSQNEAHEKALEAAKKAEEEKMRAQEEMAKLKAEAALKEAHAWQLEQERLKDEEERRKEREQFEARQKEEVERAKAIEQELLVVKQRQAEMEAKVREAELKKDEEERLRLKQEQEQKKKEAELLQQKQREVEQKIEQVERERQVVQQRRQAQQQQQQLQREREREREERSQRQVAPPPVPPAELPSVPKISTPNPRVEREVVEEQPVKKIPRRRCGPTWCD